MRHYFLDTSALVKLYVIEPGSRRVRDMVRSASVSPETVQVMVCDLVHPEAASALCQTMDGPLAPKRGIGRSETRKLPGELARDLRGDGVMAVTESARFMTAAANLVWKHRLRGADAVHLATALNVRGWLPKESEFYFVGSDRAQNAAAAAEGLEVLDPTF